MCYVETRNKPMAHSLNTNLLWTPHLHQHFSNIRQAYLTYYVCTIVGLLVCVCVCVCVGGGGGGGLGGGGGGGDGGVWPYSREGHYSDSIMRAMASHTTDMKRIR